MAEPGSVADLVGGADAVVGFTGLALDRPGPGAPNLPVVEIDPPRVQPGHGRVELERATATGDAVRHLLGRGVRRPVVMDLPGSTSRGRAFTAAFRAAGVEPVAAPREAGWADLRDLDPDALVAFNDLDGFRLLRDLARDGVGVPERVKVVGVDGLAVGEFVTPRLSTLAIDLAEVARAALDLVVELSERRAGDPVRVVPHRFVARDST
nr:substrate-binding domain-containing protein [Kineococcus aurantiacus]